MACVGPPISREMEVADHCILTTAFDAIYLPRLECQAPAANRCHITAPSSNTIGIIRKDSSGAGRKIKKNKILKYP